MKLCTEYNNNDILDALDSIMLARGYGQMDFLEGYGLGVRSGLLSGSNRSNTTTDFTDFTVMLVQFLKSARKEVNILFNEFPVELFTYREFVSAWLDALERDVVVNLGFVKEPAFKPSLIMLCGEGFKKPKVPRTKGKVLEHVTVDDKGCWVAKGDRKYQGVWSTNKNTVAKLTELKLFEEKSR